VLYDYLVDNAVSAPSKSIIVQCLENGLFRFGGPLDCTDDPLSSAKVIWAYSEPEIRVLSEALGWLRTNCYLR